MKAPQAPDPKETAAAQGQMNRETALSSQLMNMVNQVGPTGSLTYTQTGNTFLPSSSGQTYYRGPNGEIVSSIPQSAYGAPSYTPSNSPAAPQYNSGGYEPGMSVGMMREQPQSQSSSASPYSSIPSGWEQITGHYQPQYTATTSYTPEEQAIFDKLQALRGNIAGIGVEQSQRLGQLLGSPLDLSNEATESRLMELGRARLDPALDRRRASTEQDLYNRGVRGGSEAYARAMEGVTQGENDAYNQLLLSGRAQSVQEQLAQRNQGINEIMALASGTQVQQPQSGFVNTPGANVAPVDYTGLVNQKYQADVANHQAGMSGLFGLGSTLLGGWMASDERLKTDKHKTGAKTQDGVDVYTYRYKGSPMMQMGVMAQDVEKKRPSAVKTMPNGYKAVHYPTAMGARA